jgi:tripartite ATP-independent transporter DctM subunit
LGVFRGGLAHATIVTCSFFAACTGSSIASVGAIGPIAMTEMKRFNYHPYLACGCIATGGSLGILIPPSLAFIVYGYICEVPIGPLFIAGIIPGILLSVMLILTVYIICLRNPEWGPEGPSYPWRTKIKSVKKVFWSLGVFVTILGGLYFGIFTPTEAGGMGAFAVFFFLIISRRLTWKILIEALKDTARTTCMIFIIFIGAKVFNSFLSLSGVPQAIIEFAVRLPLPPYLLIGMILLAYIPLGCVIDSLPLFVLTLPIVYPIVDTLGFNPLWFGVLLVLVASISLITPPVGMNVYVLSGVTGEPLGRAFRGSIPFLVPMIFTLMLIFFFPILSTFLPDTMR